jgi:ATP-dependent DNA ligase
MLAGLVDQLPTAGGWLYEPKWDGFRCIVIVDADGRVRLLSRRGTSLNDAFPDVAAAVSKQLPAGTIADGEIVRWSTDGRLDFEALQRRNRSAGRGVKDLARTEPCHLILFDLLRHNEDLTLSPLTERRAQLEQLLSAAGGSVLVLGMQTDDLEVARVWFDQLAAVGVEGIVAKRAREPYRPGARSWVKIKHYTTTEAIVGGVTGALDRPESLVLGRIHRSDGQLHIAGRTTDLNPALAERIASEITPADDDHPWPAQLPPSWHDRVARDYHRVIPELVVEIRVDVASSYTDDGPSNWRHRLRVLRTRTDLTPQVVPLDLDLHA